jgi:hypothetical protein
MTSNRVQANHGATQAMQAMETLQAPNHAQEKRDVLDAIKTLGFKVTVGSVAESTGLPVLKVNGLLNRIAYETQGQLVVDTAGSVTYKFAPSFESKYLLNTSRDFFRWAFRIAFNATAFAIKMLSLALFFLIRVSFGILLVASVVLVAVLIIAAIIGMITRITGSSSDAPDLSGDGTDLLGGLGNEVSFDWLGGLRYWTFDWIWDWWLWPRRYFWWDPWDPWYRSRYDYYDNWDTISCSPRPAYAQPAPTRDTAEDGPSDQNDGATAQVEQNRNFLDNCFAVLFGTGDPNAQLEAERWRTVVQAIKAKSGVVLAEDLAPYLDTTGTNEDWMLPILIRFNGCPDVTDSGKLVYTFPSFVPQHSAPAPTTLESSRQGAKNTSELDDIYARFLKRQKANVVANANAQALPLFIQEQLWTLTGISAGQVALVVGFACFASLGAIGLLTNAADFPYVLMLRPVLLGIAAYAGLFILMPLMRWPWVISMNSRIDQRNTARIEAAQKLAYPTQELTQFQQEADAVRRDAVTGDTTTAYTTEEDLLEQEFKTL